MPATVLSCTISPAVKEVVEKKKVLSPPSFPLLASASPLQHFFFSSLFMPSLPFSPVSCIVTLLAAVVFIQSEFVLRLYAGTSRNLRRLEALGVEISIKLH